MSGAGMWVAPGEDPRPTGTVDGELATIRQYLTHFRLTLGMKCDGLDARQLATRSVPPSTMSLLGLIRHMGRVEHHWFHRVLRGRSEVPRLYWAPDAPDLDFDGATADPELVQEAFTTWKAQIAAADEWLDQATDLGATDLGAPARMPDGDEAPVRDILIHMIEEYARHCGHADLLRECVDGRTGQ